MRYHRPKGTRDILPDEALLREWVLDRFKRVVKVYGFEEIQTPTFESTELFVRSSGETSDIATKQMYSFKDKKGREISLRPEGTAGVIRAVLENRIKIPCRLFYIESMFRYERPQKGRFREHLQFGVEVLGEKSPKVDTEIIEMAVEMLKEVGVEVNTIINTVGCRKCQPEFKKALSNFLEENRNGLCKDCQIRAEKNPLRVFDCKDENCQRIYENAPKIEDYLCDDCRDHFNDLKKTLKIDYRVNLKLVRGLDYYTKTVFEFESEKLGAKSSLGGGGRYDNLVEEMGGSKTPALGFGLGIDRILLAMKRRPEIKRMKVFIAPLGKEAIKEGEGILKKLRDAGISAIMDYEEKRLKEYLHRANLYEARYSIIIGSDELSKGVYSLKDMNKGDQLSLNQEELLEFLKERCSQDQS